MGFSFVRGRVGGGFCVEWLKSGAAGWVTEGGSKRFPRFLGYLGHGNEKNIIL